MQSFLTLEGVPSSPPALPKGIDAVWIFGPTASGKSALALSIAREHRAVILNADASQRYAALSILTARPSAGEMAQAPHALYGTLEASSPASVASWLAELTPALAAARAEGRLPILVGGTGLYLSTALHGLSPVPASDPATRDQLRAELATHGLPTLLAELHTRDPALATRLKPGDTQRILRGLEVARATGRPLSAWQALPKEPALPPLRWWGIRLMPPRELLYIRIDRRAEQMLDHGALDEVAALQTTHIPANAPIRKAIGVPELSAHLAGTLTRAEALAALQQATRRYAKRQLTWARHQL